MTAICNFYFERAILLSNVTPNSGDWIVIADCYVKTIHLLVPHFPHFQMITDILAKCTKIC